MESNKLLARPGYLLAAMLFLIPLTDSLMSVWPIRLGEERWRFGAIGSLSNITLIPLLAMLLALAIAIMSDHRRFRRVLGWLSAVFAVTVACMAVLFILDFFQARTQVRPQFQGAMDMATTVALIKLAGTIIVLALIARAGLSGPKAIVRKDISRPASSSTPLIPLSGSVRPD